MKQVNKLILAIACYALCAVLLLGGSLYLLADPALKETPAPTPGQPDGSQEQLESTEAPVPTPPPMTADIQNALLIDQNAFTTPANKYRALKIEHSFANLPGETPADKVQSFSALGFGGMATNVSWGANYLQSSIELAYFNDFVQAMHNAGYRVWLYDEKGYPSGAAGDLTVKDHPEYAAVRLMQVTIRGNGTTTQRSAVPDDFVKVEYACIQTGDSLLPLNVSVSDGQIIFDGLNGDWTAYVYCVTRYNYGFEWNSSYPNILNRDAVARFIEVTFDTYYGAIDRFPEVIEAVFDDEAQLLANHHIMPEGLTNPVIPYDYDIFDTFRDKYGYDVRPLLPLLYSGESALAQRVRAQFYAHVGDLVSENYYGQIQEWCEAHGTQLSGHLLLEEQMVYHVPVYGDYIKCSQSMGYSGFDVLDVRPKNYIKSMSTGGKYASSPAWLMGKERVMIEICPVANPEEFNTKHLDYALGCMTFAYFDGGNQITSYYSQANNDPATGRAFNTYVGRLGSITVGAQNLSQVAIFYSIDSAAGSYQSPTSQNLYDADGTARQNDRLTDQIADGIRREGLDYVFLDDASLQSGTASADGLQVGSFNFTTILVPGANVIDIQSMRMLDTLIDLGVNVVFVGTMPAVSLTEQDQTELETLSQKHAHLLCEKYSQVVNAVTTTPTLDIKTTARYVYASPYQKDGVKFFFLANNSTKDAELTFSFEGAVGYRIYDPVSGEIFEVKDSATIQSYRALFVQPLLAE